MLEMDTHWLRAGLAQLQPGQDLLVPCFGVVVEVRHIGVHEMSPCACRACALVKIVPPVAVVALFVEFE